MDLHHGHKHGHQTFQGLSHLSFTSSLSPSWTHSQGRILIGSASMKRIPPSPPHCHFPNRVRNAGSGPPYWKEHQVWAAQIGRRDKISKAMGITKPLGAVLGVDWGKVFFLKNKAVAPSIETADIYWIPAILRMLVLSTNSLYFSTYLCIYHLSFQSSQQTVEVETIIIATSSTISDKETETQK